AFDRLLVPTIQTLLSLSIVWTDRLLIFPLPLLLAPWFTKQFHMENAASSLYTK
ncbi:hypothetical protein LINPERHAP1_LOCUS18508, partial [Linum perenne]